MLRDYSPLPSGMLQSGVGYAQPTQAVPEKAAATTKRAVTQHGPQAWPLFFNPATTYAQAAAKVSVDPKLSAERREELATKYVQRSIELLTEAHRTAGPKFQDEFVKKLRTDTDLNPIRQRPEFVEVLKTIDANTLPK